MAIQYYSPIDLTKNEIQNVVIQKLGANPTAGNSAVGMIIYRTDENALFVCTNATAPTWVEIGTGQGVDALAIGNAGVNSGGVNTGLTVSAATGSITLTPKIYGGGANVGMVPTGGTAAKVLLGDGSWANYEQGDITGIDAGAGIVVNDPTTATPEVAIDYLGGDNVILAAADGTSVTLADADDFIFSDASDGPHAKYANLSQLKTYINAGTMSSWTMSDGTTTQTVDNGETVTFTKVGSTASGLVSLIVSATNTVTANAIIGATGTATANTLVDRDGSGNIWVTTVNGELNGTISTATTAITQTSGNNTTRVATTAFVQDAVSGLVDSWTIAGDTGSTAVDNGQTVTIAGSTGIDTAESTRTVTVSLDLNELPTITDYDSAADHIVVVNGGSNAKTLSTKIPLNDWAIPDGDVAMGTNGGTLYKIIDLKDPVNLQDAATKNYVDSAVTGLLEFKGGFNPATGEITSGTNNGLYLWGGTRVAISKGDLYVSAGSTSGNFYGDTDYPLTPGDTVYAIDDASANQSVVGDWAVAQADTDLATAGANAGAASVGISSYDSANFSVATGFVSITNVDLGTETTGNYTATVAASAANNLLGISVGGATGEGQAAVVGLDITGRTALGAVPAADDYLLIYDTTATTNKKVSTANLAGIVQDTNSYAETVTLSAGVAKTVTHSLGSFDVMVQLYDATTYITMHAEVDRTGSNTITVTATTAPPNNIRVLVQKIIA
jgi:hypothetical protein